MLGHRILTPSIPKSDISQGVNNDCSTGTYNHNVVHSNLDGTLRLEGHPHVLETTQVQSRRYALG